MTPDRIDHSPDGEPENGMLSDSENLDTTALGILGGTTEQVSVSIPLDDRDDSDDDVVDDELAPTALGALGAGDGARGGSIGDARTEDVYPDTGEIVTGEIVPDEIVTGEIDTGEFDTGEIVTGDITTAGAEPRDTLSAETVADETVTGEIVTGEIVTGDAETADADADSAGHGEPDTATAEWASVAGEGELDVDAVVSDVDGELVDVGTESTDALERAGHPAPSHPETKESAPPVVAPPAPVASVPPAAPIATLVPTPSPAAAPARPPVSRAAASAAPAGSPSRTASGSIPTTRREAMHSESERLERAHAVERVQTHPEVNLTSKRLGEFEAGRESSDLLTPDRLLDPHQVVRPEPEGAWQHFVYSLTGHRVNLGDGKRARDRKALDRRISVPLPGGARFVPVLSRKGGVGKTTVTTLLGMALADARDDRIIAIDANPDRGTLAERIARTNGKTIRDLVRMKGEVSGYSDISSIVARDDTRLDVLASDADPRVSEALNDRDYLDVASIAAHYYSIVLTDTGTGIVHSVMSATLDAADQFVIVSGLSVDEARLASETLTWLETNGYAEQARNAIVVLNSARPGAPLVRPEELEAHFGTRVRAVVRVPYDPLVAAGSAITFRDLQPATRLAARALAASVVEGLRSLASAA